MTWPTLDQIVREAVIDSLRHAKGNVSDAAKLLGISRATMYRKLKKYGFKSWTERLVGEFDSH